MATPKNSIKFSSSKFGENSSEGFRNSQLNGINSFEDFIVSKNTQDAVITRLEMIGFTVKDMSPYFKKLHPNVDWKKLVAMAKFLKEKYFDVDLKLVYRTATCDMPKLKENLVNLI